MGSPVEQPRDMTHYERGQVQRCSGGTLANTASMCLPQPRQVVLPHLSPGAISDEESVGEKSSVQGNHFVRRWGCKGIMKLRTGDGHAGVDHLVGGGESVGHV